MRKNIVQSLLNSPHKDGDRLPSVRALMVSFAASSATVQAALKELEKEKHIYCVQGKGNFWGIEPEKVVLPTARESVEERLERLFKEDFEKGFISPQKPLPLVKELQLRYQISPQMLRHFLMNKVRLGVLQKEGRKFSFVKSVVPKAKVSLTELLFVTRCDVLGSFATASEREMDFLRLVYRRAGSSRYRLILLGYDEASGKLLDRNGRICKLSDFPNAVGALVSTLLVQKPLELMQKFSRLSIPVSIWWEHPASVLPSAYLNNEKWFFFNSSFGTQPGTEVGKFLLRYGVQSVVYFSPYHNSSWSKDRLLGLEQVGIKVHASVDAEKASPWDFKVSAKQFVEKYAVDAYAHELTKIKMIELVKQVPVNLQGVPWVCVNDEAATILAECAEEGACTLPNLIIGFDNSAESYLFRLPSYEFNTENLVEQMFYAVECPSNFLGTRKILQIRGSVVEK